MKSGVTDFAEWYSDRSVNERTGCIEFRNNSDYASAMKRKYMDFKREMDARCSNFHKFEMLADGEVISKKADLPNVSSGETAGIVRRIARNLVQNAPNVEIISKFDDDSVNGIIARHILMSKVIGAEQYSNDMQQNLFASVKTGLTTGFDCVVPCLLQQADGSWYVKYDNIHYRDVFPEPGAKDVRDANEVFVRRYLTAGDVKRLIRMQPEGWDIAALKQMLQRSPVAPPREAQSNAHADTKRRVMSSGYEIITWYSNTGQPFLTFTPNENLLLRIERNTHPLKWHPVFFLVLEKDSQQPLGKSQVELLLGRQEFQDLMHNGAMKLWYRNINPSIIGYGTVNSIPNLSPGKYTPISNPNAKIEPFEVNTGTLMQYTAIAQSNLGSMVNLVGAADQQMATQAGGGMSATPQGVEAQQAMVDITTNNYQKAIESFVSKYCSYALTIYFQELKGVKKITPSAEARLKLVNAGAQYEYIDEQGSVHNIILDALDENGVLEIDFSELAVEYFVRCIPGSLVEMEDEKQLRILQELFVPLSQAMPALAATQDRQLISNAVATMQFIMETQIELSGSNRSRDLHSLLKNGRTEQFQQYETKAQALEDRINGMIDNSRAGNELMAQALGQMQEQIKLLSETQGVLLKKLGAPIEDSSQPQRNESQTPERANESPATV